MQEYITESTGIQGDGKRSMVLDPPEGIYVLVLIVFGFTLQIRTVSSSEQDASRVPSGENSTELIPPR